MLSKHHFSGKEESGVTKSAYKCSKCENEVYLTLPNGEYITLEQFLEQK